MPSHGGTRQSICPFISTNHGIGLKAVVEVLHDTDTCVVLFSFGMEDISGLVRDDYPTHPQPREQETAFMDFAVPAVTLQQRALT